MSDYDQRSLEHERRMVSAYRRKLSDGDASFAQALANACWRASCFEWALYRDADTVRRLWGEAARTLAEGFARRRPGFDPSPDQLTLALHFAVAAREREAFTQLALATPTREGALHGAQAFRNSRAHFHLAEGYAGVARALVERKSSAALAAAESLDAARRESDAGWWERQYPNPLESAWRAAEHEAVCALLGAVARRAAEWLAEEGAQEPSVDENDLAAEFARAVDDALARLRRFVTREANHHPKLYVWLPGLALCALAASAQLPVEWLAERHESKADGYERLPPELLQNPPAQ